MKFRNWMIVSVVLVMAIASVGAVSAQSGQPGDDGPRDGRAGRGSRIAMNLLEIMANEIGIEPEEIVNQVRSGSTLAEVITNNGHDVDVVGEAVITEATSRIQEAVTNGNLSQENADRLIDGLQTRWDDFVNREFSDKPSRGNRERGIARVRSIIGDAIVKETGLELDAIREQIQSGMTPAEVIEANGGNVDVVIANAVASLTVEIETAVADGNLSQDAADQLLENLEQYIIDVVNGELPDRPGGRNGRGNRGKGGFLSDDGNVISGTDA